jgi:hypothetical protein
VISFLDVSWSMREAAILNPTAEVCFSIHEKQTFGSMGRPGRLQ